MIKLIKKERLERFYRFKDKDKTTRRGSLYRYISVSSWVGADLVPFLKKSNTVGTFSLSGICSILQIFITILC